MSHLSYLRKPARGLPLKNTLEFYVFLQITDTDRGVRSFLRLLIAPGVEGEWQRGETGPHVPILSWIRHFPTDAQGSGSLPPSHWCCRPPCTAGWTRRSPAREEMTFCRKGLSGRVTNRTSGNHLEWWQTRPCGFLRTLRSRVGRGPARHKHGLLFWSPSVGSPRPGEEWRKGSPN